MTLYKNLRRLLGAAAVATLAISTQASAGNIIITGHDTDDHNASDFMNWALTALLQDGVNVTANIPVASQNTARIGYIGNSSASLGSYLGFYDNFEFYDLDDQSGGATDWRDAFSDGNDILIIGSGLDFVVNGAGGDGRLAAAAAMFATYFNAGRNLFVNTEQGNGSDFYDFIPSFGTTNNASLPGCTSENGDGTCMDVTAQGTVRGHTRDQIVDANITHNRFNNVDPLFETLSIYVNSGGTGTGDAITIAAFEVQVGNGGGFTPTCGGANQNPCPISEPGSIGGLAIFAFGLAGVGLARRRRSV